MRLPTRGNLWVYILLGAILLGAVFSNTDSHQTSSTLTPITSPTPTQSIEPTPINPSTEPSPDETPKRTKAIKALEKLPIKGRAPKTGYTREQFADDWGSSYGCDTRNRILRRDFLEYRYRTGSDCIIESGILQDPYTGKTISFLRGIQTSLAVQIDHVVALSDAWQKGAQRLSAYERYLFYNDPLNLLAVDGPANSQKGDSDAASWLPSNKSFRCDYVARQIAVKMKYNLWVTDAEHQSMRGILQGCPKQRIPRF